MDKRLTDMLTFLALYIGFASGLFIESTILSILVYALTAYAFIWSLERNVDYGYELAMEEMELLEDFQDESEG